ncbi:putative sterol esterase 2 [Phaeomoniella chlamydospora]|uniref:Putative sterol esterase 2 n=1 Tax=Phaeomoniella chlamydospora TaxID=158046 RepID=A0A0G2HD78_PHACM|nr:putative sterol esterase 2 [Phaeomoniella chlamydospora]
MADNVKDKAHAAIQYARQAEKLSLSPHNEEDEVALGATAVEAKFITPLDNVVETASGERLPGVPPSEALKFNELKHRMEGVETAEDGNEAEAEAQRRFSSPCQQPAQFIEDPLDSVAPGKKSHKTQNLGTSLPPARTHPLFPPLPLYGPPSLMRNLQCRAFQVSSFFLSLAFLGVIVLGAIFTSIPRMWRYFWYRFTLRNPDVGRPMYEEEKKRRESRHRAERAWSKHGYNRRRSKSDSDSRLDKAELGDKSDDEYVPTEGGPDNVKCDVRYYARRVGLDIEEFKVQTEDGFIITLWHIFNPQEYESSTPESRSPNRPVVFPEGYVERGRSQGTSARQFKDGHRRYPVLMIHGLLQSAGAYCVNDDHSLAFYLAKSGYDVWLGNNRCGFDPEHSMLRYSDPRMWAWNIRQMGVMDLPALISRVLSETGFEKLGLICHSQGTTQTFVALAKEQRPDLGEKISVFCALAPAVYAGPLIGKMYFKFMRIISPAMFRVFFGIHAFIPFMMTMHRTLPARLYGFLGYLVFSFLFNWTDERWDRGLRARMFQFAPVYVSSESMRWWLGRECFAKQKCILSTRDQEREAEMQDGQESDALDVETGRDLDEQVRASTGYDEEDAFSWNPGNKQDGKMNKSDDSSGGPDSSGKSTPMTSNGVSKKFSSRVDQHAWYSKQCPPFAFWIAGNDDLVDGERLLRRFKRGREPHVNLVHSKVIPGYEHLDVIWAMDCIDTVGTEVKEVIWKTAPAEAQKVCRVPKGCEDIQPPTV